MKRKAYAFMSGLFLLLAASCYSILNISNDSAYITAAGNQSAYELNVAHVRGMIYDCNMQPMVNRARKSVAAVAPTIETIAYLNEMTEDTYRDRFRAALEDGKPFVLSDVDADLQNENVFTFEVPERYGSDQNAIHLIGYIDGQGKGVTGLEKAMDDVLSRNKGKISVIYHVNAHGQVIAGDEKRVINTVQESRIGVVTTIDLNIQRAAERTAKKLGAGAVLVAEAPSCELRAMVSVPGYEPSNVAVSTNNEQNPLLNRAMNAYSPGSVFKLVVASQLIEERQDGLEFECTGSVLVDGMKFSCMNEKAHGKLRLEDAIAQSCNCYFVNAARSVSPQSILATAQNYGLGVETEFGRGLYAGAGLLPTADILENKRALANFSFGQGTTMVTPIQICAMTNAIASDGVYTEPSVIAGAVDDNLKYQPLEGMVTKESKNVVIKTTARKLQAAMEKAVEEGTATKAKPENTKAGIKTGTAQTGSYENEKELNHYWYTGYICDTDGPRYVITVFREGIAEDNGVTASVFKELAEDISDLIL